jgi:hypothetical protein
MTAVLAQPWRVLRRGSFLFTTNERPRRRTTIEPGRAFSPRNEFLTFIDVLLWFVHVRNDLGRPRIPGRTGRAG